jgi:hypothetical protein
MKVFDPRPEKRQRFKPPDLCAGVDQGIPKGDK